MSNLVAFLLTYLAVLLIFVTRHKDLQLSSFKRLQRIAWWVLPVSSIPYGFLYGWEVGIPIWLCVAMFCALLQALLAPIKPNWLLRHFPLSVVGLLVLEQVLLTIG
ncbi:hypothetical protein [Microbulbifer sp. SSSA005]|uniref:hypothetical protein n=1 Tax=Microbulbifer sp. SSSA005 TaxID=3243378 RepID=UPI00403A34E2